MVRLLAERSDTKSNVKLGGFWSQLHAPYVSSHTEELWYNETVCLWKTIYIYWNKQIVLIVVFFFIYQKNAQFSLLWESFFFNPNFILTVNL